MHIKNITKDFKFMSYFNVLMIFLSSCVLLVPMVLYVDAYNHAAGKFLDAGINKQANLGSAIPILVIVLGLIILFGWLWIRDLKIKTNNNLSLVNFKWVLITIGVNLLSLLFFTIAFFCLWLIPINGMDVEINQLNYIRLLAYIATYASLLILSFLASTLCLTWTNLRISYSLTKSK